MSSNGHAEKPTLSAKFTHADETLLVELAGELDLATAPALTSLLARGSASQPAQLVVDLSGVEFMDLTGLTCLLAAADEESRRLRIRRPTPRIAELIRLCKVEDRLPIAE